MANIKSQKKRILTNEKARIANKHQKSEMKTLIKKSTIAIKEKAANIEELIKETFSKVDKAVKNNIIHKNKGAKIKAKLDKIKKDNK